MHVERDMTADRPIARVLSSWLGAPGRRDFVTHRTFPSHVARCRAFPDGIDQRLVSGLAASGIDQLYEHQLRATEALQRGVDVVIATPTASGKTLCYNLSVFQRLLVDSTARALYLFPTKALARDQAEALRALARQVGAPLGVAVYDGDTPPGERRAARNARIVLTNPDMLHTGILPHHASWAALFAGLTHLVVDEIHVYRGVFGSHVANVLRRLRRIARFYGAQPQCIGTSATIANPQELASRLFGTPVEAIRETGAPSGERHFLIYNPPPIDPALGVRESYLKAACRLTHDLVGNGISTLVFCRSRKAVEVLVRYVREVLAAAESGPDGGAARGRDPGDPDPIAQRVRGYRGGYLPDRRRGIERSLRSGETDVVIATSALELGIDIGSLDAVVLAGWPGSRAAAWQRAGRAGRRLEPSLTVLVASSDPLDQFVANDADYLFGQTPEHARNDPDNVSILVPHIKCAAFELPFAAGEPFGSLEASATDQVLDLLADAALLHRSAARYYYVGDQFPANDVSLRGQQDENFLVIDQTTGEVLAEVDYRDAPQTLHDNAIYQLEGKHYQVHRLDHENHKAYVSAVDADYFTEAHTQRRLRVLERLQGAQCFEHGEIHLVERVVGFKKIKLFSHENAGYGEVDQPDREVHTTALWLTLPSHVLHTLDRSPAELAAAMLGLSHLLHTAGALLLMSDHRDLGSAVGDARSGWFTAVDAARRSPYSTPDDAASAVSAAASTIFLYDQYAGGTGLSERLFDERAELLRRAAKLLDRCNCERGCPGCIGPGRGAPAKRLAADIVSLLRAEMTTQQLLPAPSPMEVHAP